jgi:hypothetical protein
VHEQEEFLAGPKDRVLRDPHLFDLGKELRLHVLVRPFVFLNRVGFDSQFECISWHVQTSSSDRHPLRTVRSA